MISNYAFSRENSLQSILDLLKRYIQQRLINDQIRINNKGYSIEEVINDTLFADRQSLLLKMLCNNTDSTIDWEYKDYSCTSKISKN